MPPKFFVNDKTRQCQIVSGPGVVEQVTAEGFREVTSDEQDTFRAVTKTALDAGWNPERISYAKFMAKHPNLQPI